MNISLQNFLKYTIYLGLFSLLFVPVIVNNSLLFPFITGKAYFFRIVVIIIFFLWLMLAIYNKEYRPKKSLLMYSLLAFCFSIFISNFYGANWTASFWSNFERMEGYITILHLLALFLVASHTFRKEKHWDNFFNALIITSFLIIISSFIQIADKGWNFRIDTYLGNPIYVAGYMLMTSFISLFMLVKKLYNYSSKKFPIFSTIFYLTAFILQTIILFQTGTRGAMIGWFVGLFSFIFIGIFGDLNNKIDENKKDKKIKNNHISGELINKFKKNLKPILFFVIIILFSFIAFIYQNRDSNFVKDNVALNRLASISLSEGTAKARILNWQIALKGFQEKPFFGWGQSNYNLVFDKYYLPAMHGNESWFDRTHNIVFDWLIAGGAIGLTLYLAILISFIYLVFLKRNNLKILEKSILIGLLIAYFVHNMFVFDNLVSYLIFIFILSYAHSISGKESNFMQKNISDYAKNVFAMFCLISIPVIIYFTVIPSYQSNRDLINAMTIIKNSSKTGQPKYIDKTKGNKVVHVIPESLSLFEKSINRNTFGNAEIIQQMLFQMQDIVKINDETYVEQKDLFINKAVSELKKYSEEFPNDAKYKYMLGFFLSRFGEYQEAQQYYEQMLILSPNKQVTRIPLIYVYQKLNQKEKAYQFAKETYQLDQSHDDVWFEYAKAVVIYDSKIIDDLLTQTILDGKAHRGENFLNYLIEKNSDNPKIYISLSAFYNKMGEKEKAISILDDVIEKFPNLKNQIEKIKNDITTGNLKSK